MFGATDIVRCRNTKRTGIVLGTKFNLGTGAALVWFSDAHPSSSPMFVPFLDLDSVQSRCAVEKLARSGLDGSLMKPFFMVKGGGPTSVMHDFAFDAIREGERLARENPGIDFHILQSIRTIRCGQMTCTKHAASPLDDGDVPF